LRRGLPCLTYGYDQGFEGLQPALNLFLFPNDKDNPCAAFQGREGPVKDVLLRLDQKGREKREKTAY